MDIQEEGYAWARAKEPPEIPATVYCATRDVFTARAEIVLNTIQKQLGEAHSYLMVAIAGELGNNAFDHNLGNWPDIPGIFFAYDDHHMVIADRGQGILQTIQQVKPDILEHVYAVRIAFTQTIPGRGDEKRGNGLKFVSQAIMQNQWRLHFHSGNAMAYIEKGELTFNDTQEMIQGCFVVVEY